MIHLLDTDMLIFMIRGFKSSRRPGQRQRAQIVAERCRQSQSAGDQVGLSAITVSELEFGAQRSGQYDDEITAMRKVLVPFRVYDYDWISCPVHYGRIRHELESQGIVLGAMDMLIAAHALALDAVLVSNNRQHFSRISGLKTTTWL